MDGETFWISRSGKGVPDGGRHGQGQEPERPQSYGVFPMEQGRVRFMLASGRRGAGNEARKSPGTYGNGLSILFGVTVGRAASY